MHLRSLSIVLLLSTSTLFGMEIANNNSISNNPPATINDILDNLSLNSEPDNAVVNCYCRFFERQSNINIFNEIADFQLNFSVDSAEKKEQHIKKWNHILRAAVQYFQKNGNAIENEIATYFYNLNQQVIACYLRNGDIQELGYQEDLRTLWIRLLKGLDKSISRPQLHPGTQVRPLIKNYKQAKNSGSNPADSIIKSLQPLSSPELVALIDGLRIELSNHRDAKEKNSFCVDRAIINFFEWLSDNLNIEKELTQLISIVRRYHPVTTPLDHQLIKTTQVKSLAILLPIAKVFNSSLKEMSSIGETQNNETVVVSPIEPPLSSAPAIPETAPSSEIGDNTSTEYSSEDFELVFFDTEQYKSFIGHLNELENNLKNNSEAIKHANKLVDICNPIFNPISNTTCKNFIKDLDELENIINNHLENSSITTENTLFLKGAINQAYDTMRKKVFFSIHNLNLTDKERTSLGYCFNELSKKFEVASASFESLRLSFEEKPNNEILASNSQQTPPPAPNTPVANSKEEDATELSHETPARIAQPVRQSLPTSLKEAIENKNAVLKKVNKRGLAKKTPEPTLSKSLESAMEKRRQFINDSESEEEESDHWKN